MNRLITLGLVLVVVLLQSPLWFGKGGWLKVHDLENRVDAQRDTNEQMGQRNAALEAEVRDLKQGYSAVEERARTELGMVRKDEIFFQVLERAPGSASNAAAPAPAPSAPGIR